MRTWVVVGLAALGTFGLLAGAHHLLVVAAGGEGRLAGPARASCSACHGAGAVSGG